MAIETRLLGASPTGAIQEPRYVLGQHLPKQIIPIVTTEHQRFGVWKVTNRSTAGTSIITTPDASGSIVVTDIIVSTDKVNSSTTQLQFTDGTNTEVVALFDSSNDSVAVAIAIAGRLRGWADARLELVTTQTVNATVTLGYMKAADGIPFAEWDADR